MAQGDAAAERHDVHVGSGGEGASEAIEPLAVAHPRPGSGYGFLRQARRAVIGGSIIF
jgi:hypothetical protein|eukprot:CAMPEP_0198289862 /NCGR_PEP_ID=MMETSP1449-20131203/7920_1 /TAXON_ID=420275 /ORGANISM="Attheya septentrionalis, Strain CCMP2084" /LENGTH=57 /DNA_ID=CAMNT_0043988267 /DNA_START=24 /DNA_END=197 /DNA_ORIENTATION=-